LAVEQANKSQQPTNDRINSRDTTGLRDTLHLFGRRTISVSELVTDRDPPQQNESRRTEISRPPPRTSTTVYFR